MMNHWNDMYLRNLEMCLRYRNTLHIDDNNKSISHFDVLFLKIMKIKCKTKQKIRQTCYVWNPIMQYTFNESYLMYLADANS